MRKPKEDTIEALRAAMEAFIEARMEEKLETVRDEDERQAVIAAHQPSVWIADAARRAKWIRITTHGVKYTHPDARGTNVYSEGLADAGEDLIGTHSLRGAVTPDMMGSAAALDVFRFLTIKVDGKAIWQRAEANDPSLRAALPGDDDEKREWIAAFADLRRSKGEAASHNLAKQVYWPLPDGAYHLLQPLFPSSLAHAIWERLRTDRFSDAARAARKAHRAMAPHPHGYREWSDLVIRKLGGANAQNIGRLNAARRGEVWLLPALPPVWRARRRITPPLNTHDVFEFAGRFRRIRWRVDGLGEYLTRVQGWNNRHIRRGRARCVEAIIDELVQYAAAVQRLPSGWSARSDCRLPPPQRFWLDPERDDPDFQQARSQTDWPRQVAESFANWLNASLRRHRLPVDAPEYRFWRREFQAQLHEILREIAS